MFSFYSINVYCELTDRWHFAVWWRYRCTALKMCQMPRNFLVFFYIPPFKTFSQVLSVECWNSHSTIKWSCVHFKTALFSLCLRKLRICMTGSFNRKRWKMGEIEKETQSVKDRKIKARRPDMLAQSFVRSAGLISLACVIMCAGPEFSFQLGD